MRESIQYSERISLLNTAHQTPINKRLLTKSKLDQTFDFEISKDFQAQERLNARFEHDQIRLESRLGS